MLYRLSIIAWMTFLPLFLSAAAFSPYSQIEEQLEAFSPEQKIWLETQGRAVSTLKDESRDKEKIKKTFKKIKLISQEIQKPISFGTKNKFIKNNRSTYCFPFDENRTGRHIPGFYLSASDIVTPEQYYIIAQAPLSKTNRDFWRAILEYNSPLIVTIAMPIENGKQKCHDYWSEPHVPITVNGWKIERSIPLSEDILATAGHCDHRVVKRIFRATHQKENKQEERTITQIHYENWPDGDIPDSLLFDQLLKAVDDLKINKSSPIVVHCSAGIGRSGIFVAVHSLRKTIQKARKWGQHGNTIVVNIPKALLGLRLQRKSLVGSSKQFAFIYQTLAKE